MSAPLGQWSEADEAAFEAKYQAQLAAAEEAFQARGAQPPRRSQVNGPPADWRRWNALLDGVPVRDCYAFDSQEGWVEVYVVIYGHCGRGRRVDMTRRRLHGQVTAVTVAEWDERRKKGPVIELTIEHLRGDPVPGTEMRRSETHD